MARCSGIVLLVLLAACADAPDDAAEPFVGHETVDDFVVLKNGVPGIPGSFDRHHVMDDAFFTAGEAATEAQVQRFLERTPYGTRSFLAGERIGGRSAAAAIVAAARDHGISPIVLLARMQVEKSLVARTARPSASSVDYAFGCGCPDNRRCNAAYKGLDRQLACAAETLRGHYDGSMDGTSPWVKGRSKRTLDPLTVTPKNHATASLYSYTPWVLQGRGGNWLVWNVTLKFASHFRDLGVALDGGSPPVADPWIGDACVADADCAFGGGHAGACQRFGPFGLCTVSCEGLCPDRAGRGTTFCVAAEELGDTDGGRCTLLAAAGNRFCADLAGTEARRVSRYVGRSGAARKEADACVAAEQAPREIWQPQPGTSWQWQLSGTIDRSPDVQMYAVDLFDVPDATIAALRADGRRVVCHFSAGSLEGWRPDAGDFPAAVVGRPLEEWPEARWLDIRAEAVRGRMLARLNLAVAKGCDGVAPDHVEAFAHESGFPLTAAHQLDFNVFLAREARARGLSAGLRNDVEQAAQLAEHFDWTLNEGCFAQGTCGELLPFIRAGKPVFQVEYGGPERADAVCARARSLGFDTLIKKLDVGAWRLPCP